MTVAETAVVPPPAQRPYWTASPAAEQAAPEHPITCLPGLTDAEKQCWQAFLASSALLLEALDRLLSERHQLRLFDYLVLGMLAKARGGSLRMGDLAAALAVGPSRMTQQIRRMEADGLVRRSRSTKDRRGVIATITCQGRARLAPANRTYSAQIRNHYLTPMARAQMIAMGDSCRRINQPLYSF